MKRRAALIGLLLATALLGCADVAAAPRGEPPAPPIPSSELWTYPPPRLASPPGLEPARSAADVSYLLDAPAGKHGALRTTPEGHLAFADGARARFFGVNLVDQYAFPDHATAERLAARLARAGVNLVRLTHLDAAWGERSLFFTARDKGRVAGTRRLAPESLERLDYLLHQLRQRGIYAMLVLLSARRFTAADGVADAEDVFQGASLAGHFDRRLIDLQKEHISALLRHRSRYSGKTLAEDPQLALLEITNEDSLFASDRYEERLPRRYRDALYARVRSLAPGADPRRRPFDEGTRRALLRIERDYFGELRAHLRGLGVTIPIANSNWFDGLGPALLVDAEGDFVSRHGYWDHPQGGWTARDRFDNRSALRHPLDSPVAHLAAQRVAGKPFVVVEWGFCWPNDYIAEGPLLMAAYANLQGWDALLAFNVSAADEAASLLGTGDHEVFDIGAKPHVFAQLPAAALLFHRGADAAGARALAVEAAGAPAARVREATLLAAPRGKGGAGFFDVLSLVDAHDALERPLALTVLRAAEGADSAAPPWRARAVLSAPGLRWDAEAGVLTIETPGQAAVIGACQAQPRFTLGGVTLALRTPFCAVSLSALPDSPDPSNLPKVPKLPKLPDRPDQPKQSDAAGAPTLAGARRLLLTTTARAQNSGMVFSSDRRQLRDPGRAPIQIQAVRGEILVSALTGAAPAPVTVWSLGPDGRRRARVPTRLLTEGAGGAAPRWSIRLPDDNAQQALWYEVTR